MRLVTFAAAAVVGAGCSGQHLGPSETESVPGGPNLVDCSFTRSTDVVGVDAVDHRDPLVAYLADVTETPATWWDGQVTDFLILLDTSAAIASVEETSYTFDAAASSPNATSDYCGNFHYWTFLLPVLAAQT